MKLMKVREIERDESLGIMKKDISIPDFFSFVSPSKSTKFLRPDIFLEANSRVNEIVKRIDDRLLDSLERGATSRVAREIRLNFKKDKLNLVIFSLTFDRIPDKNKLSTLAQHLYASSQATIFLPAVRTALFKENDKISEKRLEQYLDMLKFIVNEIMSVGNSKVLVGTIPLLAPKFSRPIVNFYLDRGITAFSIDANTGDLFLHEAEFRSILSTINSATPLNETFIHACNLGYPQFEKEETRADDFLSIFAYIDVLGGTFKIRGKPVGRPRLKEFSRQHYSYRILPPNTCQINDLKNINQIEQLREANAVQKLIGEEKIETYVQKKSKVDEIAIDRLKSIAEKIKVS